MAKEIKLGLLLFNITIFGKIKHRCEKIKVKNVNKDL